MATDPIQVIEIPDYEIRELIQEGGMGRVYKAWNRSLERFEAIKFIAPRLLHSEEMRERFRHEAIAVASLDHENIATLFRCGEVFGKQFLAFQYCDGGTLTSRILGQRVSREEILNYAMDLAAGLEYAHSHGIIHRDIKPSNILFHERKLKIIDFGLAKYRDESLETTRTGVAGTPQYMSPEQAHGEPADHQSDIYSFGVILYEMAAGRRPFESAELKELLQKVRQEEPPPLSSLRSDLGSEFCELVDWMLSKASSERPQSITEVISRLRDCRNRSAPNPAEMETLPLPGSERERVRRRAPSTAPTPVPTPTPLAPWARLVVLMAAAMMAVLVLLPESMEQLRRWSGAAVEDRPMIVILPFESVSKEPGALEFSDAMDARLAGELVQSGRTREYFSVSPASEVRSYGVRSVADARKRLKADYVFGGTVIRGENGYQVLLSLSDASKQRQIKAETVRVDRPALDRLDSLLRDTALRMLPERARAASPIVASASSFTNPAAYELTVRAQGLLRQYVGPGPVDAALELLSQAISLDAESAESHAWMAEAQVQKWQATKDRRMLELAEQSSRRASSLNSKLSVVRLSAGRVAQARGDWEKAISEFGAAMKLNPTDPDVYRFAGRVYLEAGKPREAEEACRKAIELNPASWTAHTSLGGLYSRLNRWDAALAEFKTAAELYPELALVHANVGAAYYKLDRIEEAADAFEASLRKRPNGLAYSNLATIRFYQGRFADSAELFEHAVAERPMDAAAWGFLGEAYARVPGKEAKSREALRKSSSLLEASLKINPRLAEPWSQLALAKAYLGDAGGARGAAGRAMQLGPNDAAVLYRAARVEAKLGEVKRGGDFLLAALEKGYPKNEVLREPDLEQVRNDPRLHALLK